MTTTSQPTFTAAQLAQAPGPSRERAERWRRTLLPVLERMHLPTVSFPELIRSAASDSARHFPQAKSLRHIRRMIQMVISRDAGAHNYDRVELYLEKHSPLIAAPIIHAAAEEGFDDLRLSVAGFKNSAAPSAEEEAAFLREAWECYQRQLFNGASPLNAKARLLDYLWRWMPWLSGTRRGLTDKISRKFKHYEQGHGEAVSLLDGRAARAGEQRAPAFNPEHTDRLIWHTVKNCGGRVAQGMEDLLHRAEELDLAPDLVEFLLLNRSAGSYVNRRLLDAVRPEVEMLRPYLLGRKAIDDATVPLIRTYDKLRSMTVVNADDLTAPVYMWLPDETGRPITDKKGVPVLTRGQVIAFLDVRSLRIIHWALIPERNYDSFSIRTAMDHICREHGLPSVWHYERGIWKSSKIIKGAGKDGWELAHSAEEHVFGWERLGVRFIHSKRARSKPIEKVFDLVQRLMEGEPGYCGRDERRDCPEETKRAKLTVEGRRAHPAKHFRSFDEWEKRLGEIVERYNSKPQHGRLAGKSPDEMFKQCWAHGDAAPLKMHAACARLTAPYVQRFTVRAGISFRFGKRTFAYWDETLSDLRHREVDAWFNPEQPEFIAITDPKDRAGFSARIIERHNPPDYLAALNPDSPEAENHRRETAKQNGFNAYPKARFHTLKAKFATSFRTITPDLNTVLMATNLANGASEHVAARREEDTIVRRIQDKARRLNMGTAELRDYSPETEASLDRRLNARRAAEMETEPQ